MTYTHATIRTPSVKTVHMCLYASCRSEPFLLKLPLNMAQLDAETPARGDRILVFKKHWLTMILDGAKTLEIRGAPFKSGTYWLGCQRVVEAKARFGQPFPIRTEDHWRSLRDQHQVQGPSLPYKKTYGLPVLAVERICGVKYKHKRGAVGIVRFERQ